jgi:hypothetical protein
VTSGVSSWRDGDGEEWVPSIVAAERLAIDPHRVRDWVRRDRVRSERVGRHRWVNYQDCAAQELRTRTTGRAR